MMKKLLLGAAVVLLMVSCAGRNAEKERDDSIRSADSIAAVEASQAAEQAHLDSIKFEEQRLKPSAFLGVSSSSNHKEFYLLDENKIFSNLKNMGFTKGKTKKSEYTYTGEWQYLTSKTDFTNDSQESSDNITVIVYNIDKGGICEDENYVKIKFKDERNKEAFIDDLLKMDGQKNKDLSELQNGYLYINNNSPLEIEFYSFEEISKFKK